MNKHDWAGTFVTLGKVLPEEVLLEYVKERIKKYEADKSEENKQFLAMAMDLFSVKVMTAGTSADDLLKKIQTHEKIDEILKGVKK